MAPPWMKRAPPDEMEQVRPLGNPELHVALGAGGRRSNFRASRIVLGQVVAQQVALLGEDRAVRLVLQLALVGLDARALGEQEAVIGGDQRCGCRSGC